MAKRYIETACKYIYYQRCVFFLRNSVKILDIQGWLMLSWIYNTRSTTGILHLGGAIVIGLRSTLYIRSSTYYAGCRALNYAHVYSLLRFMSAEETAAGGKVAFPGHAFCQLIRRRVHRTRTCLATCNFRRGHFELRYITHAVLHTWHTIRIPLGCATTDNSLYDTADLMSMKNAAGNRRT